MANASFDWVEDTTSATEGFILSQVLYGSTAQPVFELEEYPGIPSAVSFEKWHRILVTINQSISVDSFLLFTDPSPGLEIILSMWGSATSAGYVAPTWAAPQATLENTPYLVQQSPDDINVGIAGSLSGQLTTDGPTDHFVTVLEYGQASEGGELEGAIHMQLDEAR